MYLYGRPTGNRNQTTAQQAGDNPGVLKARGGKNPIFKLIVKPVQFWPDEPFFPGYSVSKSNKGELISRNADLTCGRDAQNVPQKATSQTA
jgi:hypothetical protein